MTTVQVLIEGVGDWKAGEIVKDAPLGLVDMAKKETRNAATNSLVAVLVEDDPDGDSDELKDLKQRAKDIGLRGYGNMGIDKLREAVEVAEAEKSKMLNPDGGAQDGKVQEDGTNPNQ